MVTGLSLTSGAVSSYTMHFLTVVGFWGVSGVCMHVCVRAAGGRLSLFGVLPLPTHEAVTPVQCSSPPYPQGMPETKGTTESKASFLPHTHSRDEVQLIN